MKPDEIFRNCVALLAFTMAFYALVARERKTPYIVHSVYTITFVVLVSLCLSVAAIFIARLSGLPDALQATQTTGGVLPSSGVPLTASQIRAQSSAQLLQSASAWLLAFGLVYLFFKIFRERNRHLNFRDDQWLVSTWPIRFVRWAWRQLFRKSRRYEHNPVPLAPKLLTSLGESRFFEPDLLKGALRRHEQAGDLSLSVVFHVEDLSTLDELVLDLATRFLEAGCFVQYTACARHPVEFLLRMKSRWAVSDRGDKPWQTACKRIVVVDAYSPHFGFTDSVYGEWAQFTNENCLASVPSKATFAGVHTAIAQAFNRIKKADIKEARTTTLLIYERCAALIDLESNEQYRIFVRHVIPSERLWGGMFTVFVESELSDDNRPILSASSDLFIELPSSRPSKKERK